MRSVTPYWSRSSDQRPAKCALRSRRSLLSGSSWGISPAVSVCVEVRVTVQCSQVTRWDDDHVLLCVFSVHLCVFLSAFHVCGCVCVAVCVYTRWVWSGLSWVLWLAPRWNVYPTSTWTGQWQCFFNELVRVRALLNNRSTTSANARAVCPEVQKFLKIFGIKPEEEEKKTNQEFANLHQRSVVVRVCGGISRYLCFYYLATGSSRPATAVKLDYLNAMDFDDGDLKDIWDTDLDAVSRHEIVKPDVFCLWSSSLWSCPLHLEGVLGKILRRPVEQNFSRCISCICFFSFQKLRMTNALSLSLSWLFAVNMRVGLGARCGRPLVYNPMYYA